MPHELTKLDKVYSEQRKAQGLQPNGYIVSLLKSDGEVTDVQVKWLSDDNPLDFEYLLADVFDGNWATNFPNTWWLETH